MKKIKVVINKQHSLLDNQKDALMEQGDFEIFPVPEKGWTLDKMLEVQKELEEAERVVFVSPIPVLLGELVSSNKVSVGVFHNDCRDKKELPNGKIIFTPSQTGWIIHWF